MYESYYKLNIKPFDLVPNPDFLFLSKSHKRSLTYLEYGLIERVGFIMLTGEIGSGKTTIIRNLIKKHHEHIVISKVFNTRVNSEQLITMINDDFGISVVDKDRATMLRDLNDFLVEQYARGNAPVLIIDEAQNLSPKLLEDIRMLSNLETDNAKLLQIILVGQPELREMISKPGMRQLRQRISINCHLQPLTRSEMEQYIFHRLKTAGNRDAVSITEGAFNLIYSCSRGIPRLINMVCDFLLISAFAEETNLLDEALVGDVIGELDFDKHFWEDDPADAKQKCKGSHEMGHDVHSDISQALIKINRRFEHFENESRSFLKSIFREMKQNKTELHNALMSHVKETDMTISSLNTKIEKLAVQTGRREQEGNRERESGQVKRIIGG